MSARRPRRRRSVVLLGVAALPVLLLALPARDPKHAWEELRQQMHAAVSPGPLDPLHAAEAATAECTACHESLERVPDTACLDCHEEVRPGADPPTVHDTFAGACARCHADHGADGLIQLDPLAFNHARARFALEGAHARVECESCHQRPTRARADRTRLQYQGLAFARCGDCHEDPHEGSLDAHSCATCHGDEGWTGTHLRFDHQRDSRFALDATHASLACGDCHEGPRFRPLDTGCAGCHEEEALAMEGHLPDGRKARPSPHAGLVSCEDCHHPEDRHLAAAEHAARCADCHTGHHGDLFLSRAGRIEELMLRGGSPQPAQRRLRRQAHHNFVAVEQALEALFASDPARREDR